MRFILLLLVFPLALGAQTLSPQEVCVLPDAVAETSGLLALPSGSFWTHNDSGDGPFLYEVDSLGQLLRKVRVEGAQHIDWEDLAVDRERQRLYVGDFGNNANKRKDLCIYQIPLPVDSSLRSVQAARISFRYPDQYAHPPADSLKNFDLEAFFYYKDSLYLFSKNRTNPPNGWSKLYRVPAQPGDYVAELLDSLQTEQQHVIWAITSATLSPDGKNLLLLSADKLWWLHGFEGSAFLGGKIERFSLASFTQKEAISFRNNKEIWLTDERNDLGGGRLYRLPMAHLRDSSQQRQLPLRFQLQKQERPAQLRIQYEVPRAGKVHLQWYSVRARQLCPLQQGRVEAGHQQLRIKGKALCKGAYIIWLEYEGLVYAERLVWP